MLLLLALTLGLGLGKNCGERSCLGTAAGDDRCPIALAQVNFGLMLLRSNGDVLFCVGVIAVAGGGGACGCCPVVHCCAAASEGESGWGSDEGDSDDDDDGGGGGGAAAATTGGDKYFGLQGTSAPTRLPCPRASA